MTTPAADPPPPARPVDDQKPKPAPAARKETPAAKVEKKDTPPKKDGAAKGDEKPQPEPTFEGWD